MKNDLLSQLRLELRKHASLTKARIAQRFFKTAKGEYGYGDRFLGVAVPTQRRIAKEFLHLEFKDIQELLKSPIHEERLIALIILVHQFKHAKGQKRKLIYEFYLKNAARVNNWDLVDTSAHHIVGAYLDGKKHDILFSLARSSNLWKRRIAIVATFHFIRHGKSQPTLSLAKLLLKDKEELMHKAVGWMLREVGKRAGRDRMEDFLCREYKKMPRVMLRYAIEHLSPQRRKAYLHAEL